ncbi:NAD-dependent succinate-semialdehyde dehydrogenase [Pseudorhodoferax sp.]|uniref:NAD-dependent succinate-semialdehyde dehydrogenase n=1 Tax=Pseudorhodoferax sp. TaxID=1993553 RepID=UPI002DD61D89|nr:NAD-dependent succinate-semialdehyde dehydrogenase [Pseudorhodoferax sp.]
MSAANLTLDRPALLRSQCYIDGSWLAAERAGLLEVRNPANGQLVVRVACVGAAETEQAVAAAAQALPAWRARTGKERAAVLRRWFDLIVLHAEDLARIDTLEQGKPLAESRAEVAYAASFVEWFAEEAKRIDGELPASPQGDRRIVVLKQPVGVCAAITPWNLPYAMVTRKVAPALAAGCTIVVKPAEQTPLSALALALLAHEAGVPPGVLNIVVGDAAQIGAVLTSDERVRKLSFTGSTEVGRLLMRQCADTIKRLSLELGGNAPVVVFDDADLDLAVAGVVQAKFRFSGQACIAANRIYVQAGIYDRFSRALAERVAALRTGPGDAASDIGPLIDAHAVAKVEQHVHDAVAKGARVLAGGRRLEGLPSPNFFAPTLLGEVRGDMQIAQEETFGPVAPLIRFDTLEEVVDAANATPFGLAAYLFSNDHRRIWRAAEALEAGMVGINTGLISNEVGPFGGIKQSGIGREGSRHGIDEYLERKYLAWAGL